MFTTAGPTAAAALAIEFLPRHPGQHLESSEFPPEPWLLTLVGGTDADAKEFSIGNPTHKFEHSKMLRKLSSILVKKKIWWQLLVQQKIKFIALLPLCTKDALTYKLQIFSNILLIITDAVQLQYHKMSSYCDSIYPCKQKSQLTAMKNFNLST